MHKTRVVCLSLGLFFVSSLFFSTPIQAGVGVKPASLSFGSVTVNTTSSAATVVVTNNGGQTVSILQVSSSLPEFIVISPAMPIALGPHGSASFQVVFQPDAAKTFSGSIVFSTSRVNAGGTQSISVSGTGTTASSVSSTSSQSYLLSASASSLNFANTLVGSSVSQAIALTNTGTASVNLSQVAITGAGFTVSGFTGAVTLAAGQSFSLTVSFAPATAGSATGSLSFISNATNSPTTISLSGNGVQPQISVIPASVSFGNVTVGVTNTQMLVISNPGTANLSVTQASLTGTGFSFSGLTLPLSVPPGGSSAFTVSFTPASASGLSGNLTLVNNTINSPLVVGLAGTGVSPVTQLTASPVSLSFGSITTGASGTQSVTLTNTGNSSVSVSQISISAAGFSATGFALPLTLAAGQSTSFSITFAPTTSGSFSGSVTVASNATNSPLAISLSGSGAAPVNHSVTLNWTPSTSSYGGFNVYRGSLSGGPYSKVNSALIATTSFFDTSVASGQTYYYVATEVDSTGAESVYSSEVIATIP
jgi:Abnormal spindle-like microcephaly-assoc'd, ASPM-SPD-2-Hydin/HYDIN/CFA65/VesB-like, Ig-like domain/Cep192 domain 4